jgi:outer membrane protein assembly factor BamA
LVKYVTTDHTPGRFINTIQPYGFEDFGMAGMRVALHHDVRDQPRQPRRGMLVDFSATYYPEAWDVESAFGSLVASVATYVTLPVPLKPILALRGSGKRVLGDFPYFEAAFVGGGGSVRSLEAQRYAGDAALAATAELRIPLASFSLILPLDVGVFGLAETGRVYLDGESPGGWHGAMGGGFWIGVIDPTSALSFSFTNNQERTGIFIKAGLSF